MHWLPMESSGAPNPSSELGLNYCFGADSELVFELF
jgi:hypothetical protein